MLPNRAIIPRYKLLMCYNIRPGMTTVYYRYVTGEFVPAMADMQVYMLEAWHTAYGDYPIRQIEFVVEDMDTLHDAFDSDRWVRLENRLKTFTTDYYRKVVNYRSGFQF